MGGNGGGGGEEEEGDKGGVEKEKEGGERGDMIEVPELKTALDLLEWRKKEGHRPLQITQRDLMNLRSSQRTGA